MNLLMPRWAFLQRPRKEGTFLVQSPGMQGETRGWHGPRGGCGASLSTSGPAFFSGGCRERRPHFSKLTGSRDPGTNSFPPNVHALGALRKAALSALCGCFCPQTGWWECAIFSATLFQAPFCSVLTIEEQVSPTSPSPGWPVFPLHVPVPLSLKPFSKRAVSSRNCRFCADEQAAPGVAGAADRESGG